MEHSNNPMDNISSISREICDKYANEVIKSHEYKKERNTDPRFDYPDPEKMQNHIRMIREYFSLSGRRPDIEEILPQSLLAGLIKEIVNSSRMKASFPAGYKMQMAVIPFNLHGQPLEEKEFNRGDHFRILLLDKPDERGLEITLGGFSGFPSYIGRLPPAELQNTAFVINKYEDDNLFNVTAKDREILIKQITDAFNLFKATLKKYLEIKR